MTGRDGRCARTAIGQIAAEPPTNVMNSRRRMYGLIVSVRVNSGLMQRSKQYLYSNVSEARASSAGGKVRPSVFAVFRLIRSSNLVA